MQVPSCAALLAQYDAVARSLMLEHFYSPAELYQRSKGLLVEASEGQPKYAVLYCAWHGGYGYSEMFDEFAKASVGGGSISLASACLTALKEGTHDWLWDRVTNAPLMAPFGRICAAEWPLLGDMARAYCAGHLDIAFVSVRSLAKALVTISQTETKLAVVAQALYPTEAGLSPWTPPPPPPAGVLRAAVSQGTRWVCQYSNSTTSEKELLAKQTEQQAGDKPLTLAELHTVVGKLRRGLEVARQQQLDARTELLEEQGHGQHFVEAMLASLALEDPASRDNARKAFVDAVKEHGEGMSASGAIRSRLTPQQCATCSAAVTT